MKLSFIIFFVLVVFFSPGNAIGQCCSAGSPVGGDGSADGLNKKELRIFASYKYSLSKVYFHNDYEADVQSVDKSYFDYNMLSATYGLLPQISLHTEFGYFIDKAQLLTIQNKHEEIRSHGLGDWAFNVRYTAIKTVKPLSQLVLSGGVKVPVGVFNEDINGVTIPVSLQPSSGAFKFNASAFYFRKRPDRKLSWNSLILFETSNTINKGYLIYKYGNFFLFSVAGTYNVFKNLDLSTNLKIEWRARDKRESDIKIESSGSKVVYFNPQLFYTFKNKWSVLFFADFPVYKFMNGYQLTNKFSFQVGVRKSFLFCKKAE
jgi:hypothetical protein